MAKSNIRGSLDTNILLRFVLDDVPKQTQAIERLLARGGLFKVPDVALIEMAFVLEKLYEFHRAAVAANIQCIIGNQQFTCNERVFEEVLPLYLANSKLSFTDCMLVAYARIDKALPLYTFDKALVKAGHGDVVEVA